MGSGLTKNSIEYNYISENVLEKNNYKNPSAYYKYYIYLKNNYNNNNNNNKDKDKLKYKS